MLSSRSYARALQGLNQFYDEHWATLTEQERLLFLQAKERLEVARDRQQHEEQQRRGVHEVLPEM